MSRCCHWLALSLVVIGQSPQRSPAQESPPIPEAPLHAKLFSLPAPGKSAEVHFTKDGTKVFILSESKHSLLSVHEVASGKRLFALDDEAVGNAEHAPMKVVLSPDSTHFVTFFGNTARVWETDAAKPVGKPLVHKDKLYSAVLSKDNKRVLSASGSGFGIGAKGPRGDVWVWDLASGKTMFDPIHSKVAVHAVWSPDESVIMALPIIPLARITFWDVAKTMQVDEIAPRYATGRFAADGKTLILWNSTEVRVFDALSRKPFGQPLAIPRRKERPLPFRNVLALQPDGKSAMFVEETNAILWGLSVERPSKLKTLEHKDLPYCFTFRPTASVPPR